MGPLARTLILACALVPGLALAGVGLEPGHDGIPTLEGDAALSCPNPVREGKFVLAWPDTGHKRERGSCDQGLAVQRWIAWYETGGRAWRAFLEAGRLEGRFESWYTNGQTRSVLEYVDGLLHGDALLWWEDGSMRGKGRYEQGLEQGCHVTFHLGGDLAAKGAYHDGQKVGRWLYWDQQGQRSKEQLGGIPLTGRCWLPLL